MNYYIQFWDEKNRRCASYDSVSGLRAARELWNQIHDFEPGTYNAVIMNEFDDRVMTLGV